MDKPSYCHSCEVVPTRRQRLNTPQPVVPQVRRLCDLAFEPRAAPICPAIVCSVPQNAYPLLASTHEMARDLLVEMATRRGAHYATLVQGGTPDSMDWPTWLTNMCVALAPMAPPVWLPMHELIDSLTLETDGQVGPRPGVKAEAKTGHDSANFYAVACRGQAQNVNEYTTCSGRIAPRHRSDVDATAVCPKPIEKRRVMVTRGLRAAGHRLHIIFAAGKITGWMTWANMTTARSATDAAC